MASAGISAETVTAVGLALGTAAAFAITLGWFWVGLALFLLNRLAAALDGAVARATTPTDRGDFLDIVFDFLVYGAFPLAFAIQDAHANALAAAFLLASFLANGSAFLAFSIMAARRGLATTRHGPKSIYHLALAEGFETIAAGNRLCNAALRVSDGSPDSRVETTELNELRSTRRAVLGSACLHAGAAPTAKVGAALLPGVVNDANQCSASARYGAEQPVRAGHAATENMPGGIALYLELGQGGKLQLWGSARGEQT